MTVEENLSVGKLYRRGHDAPTMNDILLQFPFLNDPAIRKRPARTLSGGERIVVTIARAAAMSPKVLLLDSPFLGAGPRYRASIAGLLKAWHRTKAVALVLVDHDLQTLSTVCTQIFAVENGLLKEQVV
jgi:ABC-type branched-subunit amino acid transport system ATPase component